MASAYLRTTGIDSDQVIAAVNATLKMLNLRQNKNIFLKKASS